MKLCPKCQVRLAHNSNYCEECGTKLIEAPLCECGFEPSPFDKFCQQCGKNLKPMEIAEIFEEQVISGDDVDSRM